MSYLPDTDNSVGNEDEEDDKGLDEGGDGVVVFKEGEDEGDDGGKEEDLDEQVVKLFQDQLENGLSSLHGQLCRRENVQKMSRNYESSPSLLFIPNIFSLLS